MTDVYDDEVNERSCYPGLMKMAEAMADNFLARLRQGVLEAEVGGTEWSEDDPWEKILDAMEEDEI